MVVLVTNAKTPLEEGRKENFEKKEGCIFRLAPSTFSDTALTLCHGIEIMREDCET
jgi:hypothetical protein